MIDTLARVPVDFPRQADPPFAGPALKEILHVHTQSHADALRRAQGRA